MLKFDAVSLRRGPRVLVSEATFSIFRGEKAGITGENGSGKSTLLALVRGELQPDSGHFEMPGNLQLAHVSQELDATDQHALDFVLDGDAELREVEARIAALEADTHADGTRLAELYTHYATIGGYDARARGARLMHGLGFTSADETSTVREFSGGWRVRLNVAKALMCRSDVLLLDEPTNHLDLDAILWLETWLRDYPGTLLLIAHDREFLDRIVDRIVHLEHGKATAYRGNYSAFETQRAAQLAEQSALHARQQREVRHMQAFIDRFRASATKARQAQSRIKALERMQLIAPAHVDSPFAFSFAEPDKLPRPLLALEAQQVGYGSRPIVSKLDLTVYPGDRLGLLGRNGAGKSTVMKLLAGELASAAGTRTDARDLRIGYFAQHQLEQLAADESPVENLRRIAVASGRNVTEQELRDFLATFGFRGDRVFEAVAPFSGGEKARLVLALVAWKRPNLLLLDEPTNHLDLEMRQALAMALQDYTGAVIMVSHDRHLMRTVSDRFLLVHDGRAREFDGDLDDYAAWLSASPDAAKPAAAVAPARPASPKATPAPRLKPLQTEVARCEKRMAELTAELAKVDERLASPDTHAPGAHEALRALGEERGRLAEALEGAENAWLEASESLERLQAGAR